MKRLSLAVVCFVSGILLAPVVAQIGGPHEPVEKFEPRKVAAVLAEIGYHVELRERDGGRKFLRARSGGGLMFFVEFAACGSSGCKGLRFAALFGGDEQEEGIALAALNAYNQQYAFMKAFRSETGDAVLTRYLTADYGISKGNIGVNAMIFERLARRIEDYVYPRDFAPTSLKPEIEATPGADDHGMSGSEPLWEEVGRSDPDMINRI